MELNRIEKAISDWQDYIDIDTAGRDMKKELADWLNEYGALVLIEDGVDYRDSFVRAWPDLMNEDFGNKYLV